MDSLQQLNQSGVAGRSLLVPVMQYLAALISVVTRNVPANRHMLPESGNGAEKRQAIVPMRRIATPSDIAQAAVFLASSKASYINGQEILIDGGLAQTLMSFVPRPGFE